MATASAAVILVLVGALAATAALWVKSSMFEAQRAEARLATLSTARTGVSLALAMLLADPTPDVDGADDLWAGQHSFQTDNNDAVTVVISDEGSKMNLNTSPSAFVRALSGGRLAKEDSSAKEEGSLGIHDLWELRSSSTGDDELIQLGNNLTTYTLYPMNHMSESEWLKLLANMGLTQSVAQVAAKEIIVGRQARTLQTMDALLMVTPSLESRFVKRLAKYLTSDGTVNVNTAPQTVLELYAQTVGIQKNKVEALIALRKSKPFKEMAEVVNMLGAPSQSLPLTVKTRVFRIVSTAQKGATKAEVDAVAIRTWDKQQQRWMVEVWAWSERVHKA
jgi:hypothetical protein